MVTSHISSSGGHVFSSPLSGCGLSYITLPFSDGKACTTRFWRPYSGCGLSHFTFLVFDDGKGGIGHVFYHPFSGCRLSHLIFLCLKTRFYPPSSLSGRWAITFPHLSFASARVRTRFFPVSAVLVGWAGLGLSYLAKANVSLLHVGRHVVGVPAADGVSHFSILDFGGARAGWTCFWRSGAGS